MCGLNDSQTDFYKSENCRRRCKACYKGTNDKNKEKTAKWREKNRDEINRKLNERYYKYRKGILKKQKNYRESLPEEDRKRIGKERWKKFKQDPIRMEKKRAWNKIYRIKNRQLIKPKRSARHRKKYKEDPLFRLQHLLRSSFYKAIKRKKGVKEKSIMKIVGCSQEELKKFLENKFRPEMTWKNHGKIWEIDHIIPVDSFDLTSLEQQLICFHYSNLQPLFKTTDIAKSFGYDEIGNQNKANKIF